MTYSQFLDKLQPYAEEEFARFQHKLIFTDRKIMGVRTPTLRKLAKAFSGDIDTLLAYPDTYSETVFIQLTAVSALPYTAFLRYLPTCLDRIDSWALCDSFKAKCIAKHKQEFLSVLENLFVTGKTYYVRYVLVTLLSFYVEEEYLPAIKSYVSRTDTAEYYVHMAVAWLTAEVLIKHHAFGLELLSSGVLDRKTHNKAIQKAVESYRLTHEQKEYLRSLKIK